MISILDYGAGNLKSVENAFKFLGTKTKVVDTIEDADALVLPGVGAFDTMMKKLNPFKQDLINFLDSGKPFLGICLGMQVLFEDSEEGDCKGLGYFKGSVKKLPSTVKLPQIGWNKLTLKKECKLFENIPDQACFYFVHSYAAEPQDEDLEVATCNYGKEFSAAISKGNVFATQFHPEKSGTVGLQVLKNFLEVVNETNSSN